MKVFAKAVAAGAMGCAGLLPAAAAHAATVSDPLPETLPALDSALSATGLNGGLFNGNQLDTVTQAPVNLCDNAVSALGTAHAGGRHAAGSTNRSPLSSHGKVEKSRGTTSSYSGGANGGYGGTGNSNGGYGGTGNSNGGYGGTGGANGGGSGSGTCGSGASNGYGGTGGVNGGGASTPSPSPTPGGGTGGANGGGSGTSPSSSPSSTPGGGTGGANGGGTGNSNGTSPSGGTGGGTGTGNSTGGGTGGAGALPTTGSESGSLAVLGAVLVAAGAGAMVVSRGGKHRRAAAADGIDFDPLAPFVGYRPSPRRR